MSSKECKTILFPPISVFPRNPQIVNHIVPLRITETFKEEADTVEARSGKKTSNRKGSLEFVVGPRGIRNIIKTSSSAYIDYARYDWDNNVWLNDPDTGATFRPLDIKVSNSLVDPIDHTKYTSAATPSFNDASAAGLLDLEYYYNGEVIVTNFDFTDPQLRSQIEITYTKITDNLKVKAVLISNSSNISFSTPTVDQYTLVVGRQRMVK